MAGDWQLYTEQPQGLRYSALNIAGGRYHGSCEEMLGSFTRMGTAPVGPNLLLSCKHKATLGHNSEYRLAAQAL
eukprot:6203624-Pleurochrysis_carterae.AAC.2